MEVRLDAPIYTQVVSRNEETRFAATKGVRVMAAPGHDPVAIATDGRAIALTNAHVDDCDKPVAFTIPPDSITPVTNPISEFRIRGSEVSHKHSRSVLDGKFPDWCGLSPADNPDEYTLASFNPIRLARLYEAMGGTAESDLANVLIAVAKDGRPSVVVVQRTHDLEPSVGLLMPLHLNTQPVQMRDLFLDGVKRWAKAVALAKVVGDAKA